MSEIFKWMLSRTVLSFQSFMGVSTTEELRHSIQGCKDLVKGAPEHSSERKKLVKKLVMLRLKLQEAEVHSINVTTIILLMNILLIIINFDNDHPVNNDHFYNKDHPSNNNLPFDNDHFLMIIF